MFMSMSSMDSFVFLVEVPASTKGLLYNFIMVLCVVKTLVYIATWSMMAAAVVHTGCEHC